MTTPKQPCSQSTLSDRDLLANFVAKRDEASFRLLVARHSPLVWSVCRRILPCPQDREDVFQATFLKLLQHADGKRWHDTLGGWLHKVAYRLSLKVRAARVREQPLQSSDEFWTEAKCLEQIQRQEAERALHEVIARLPQRERNAIVLYYFQHKSQHEAATELGCSVEAINSLLKRGRQKLYLWLACRGLSCSLALVALEQTLTAATSMHPGMIEKTVCFGFHSKASDGSAPIPPRIENLSHEGIASMFRSGMATNILTTLSCYSVVFMGSIGWLRGEGFSSSSSNSNAWMTSLFAWQPYQIAEHADSEAFSVAAKENPLRAQATTQSGSNSRAEATRAEIAKLIEQLGIEKTKSGKMPLSG